MSQPPVITTKWPLALERRPLNKWLMYDDATYFLYRRNMDDQIYVSKFSRVGVSTDFWKIGEAIVGVDNLIITRDKSEAAGPTANKTSVIYIYAQPNKIIYHEMDEQGQTFKMKVYKTDQYLRVIDLASMSRNLYVITPDKFIQYAVNEDRLRKINEYTNFTQNSYSKIAILPGGVFLFVKRDVQGESLRATDTFTTEEGFKHLYGRRVYLQSAGNRNYVVWKEGFASTGQYYYLTNPGVNSAISLVFQAIPGVNRQYQFAVNLFNRIHFFQKLDHVVYLKNSKTGLASYNSSYPILGIPYSSKYQYLTEDKFLLVKDVLADKHGTLALTPIQIHAPSVVCNNSMQSLKKYLHFEITTETMVYDFIINIIGYGKQMHVNATWYIIAWAYALAFGVLLISYFCMEKTKYDKIAERAKIKLGNMELVRTKKGDEVEEGGTDDSGFQYGRNQGETSDEEAEGQKDYSGESYGSDDYDMNGVNISF